jgi:GNAT superfamily N-acetyltransferase
LSLVQAQEPSPELGRYLYTAVGADWHWTDRLGWRWQDWMARLASPRVELWLATLRGTPVGYTELEALEDGAWQIEYLGVLTRYAGRGVGGHLLDFALRRALGQGASAVRVHTCSLDHPHALRAYQARGMRLVRTQEHTQQVAPQPPGPWPGAGKPLLG